jgi:mono/diheme cytochrome c family protein
MIPRRPDTSIVDFTARSNRRALAVWILLFLIAPPAGHAAAPAKRSPEGVELFEKRVRPVLVQHCYRCHSAGAKKLKGGLRLDTREGVLRGGASGPAVVPGEPGKSLLLKAVKHAGGVKAMPPERKLSDAEIAGLVAWVKMGAPDPRDGGTSAKPIAMKNASKFWSFRAVEPPAVPDIRNPQGEIRNAVDAFILARLNEKGWKPSPTAGRRTLIRRATYDLTGMPPTPNEIDAFLKDNSPDAFAKVVDRLLDSPRYGERWARHWLDIVRYGESQGFERNKFRPSAWKYRDFVVEAFNSDMPFDQFVRWQLAGDVLQPDDPLAVIASGFLAVGPYDLTAYNNGTPPMRAFAREEELEGIVATVGQAFLGLTIHCARCHNHKFDPISQAEFYQFSAALGGTFQGDEREVLTANGRPIAQKRVADLRREIERLAAQEKSADDRTRPGLKALRFRLESVVRLLQGGPVHTTRPRQPGPWHILARGDYRQPREVVAPGGIAALSGPSPDWKLPRDAPEGERRKALARWIADPRNPLTPRVIVNRLWAHHFGEGLVRTPSDFGLQGGLPSHPELLDWLAWQLVHPDNGKAWSLKRIQRLIVTSATYRQSSRSVPSLAQVDADNRLLWRQAPRRMEAEAFRDAVLAVSGEIDLRMGGPGYRDFKVSSAGDNETYTVFDAVGGDFNRRSLYRTWLRTGTSPLLDLLDCPDPSVTTPKRTVTSTPLQALALLNNRFMEHHAERFARRLQREAPGGTRAQVRRAHVLSFGRPPTSAELTFCARFAEEHGLTQLCLVLFNTNEFSCLE